MSNLNLNDSEIFAFKMHGFSEPSSTEVKTFMVVKNSLHTQDSFWTNGVYDRVVSDLKKEAARWCEKNGFDAEYAQRENIWVGGSVACQCPGCADCFNEIENFEIENGDLVVTFHCQPKELIRAEDKGLI